MFEPRHLRVEDPESGLVGFVVVDDTTLGPAAGGIRTRAYDTEDDALADAAGLARAMTFKCALAGLPAGGGKGVVMLRDGMWREAAFERLGEFVEGLGGDFLTAGDMGTTPADLAAMARHTAHVYIDEAGLADAVGQGCVNSMRACMALRGASADTMDGVRVGVQGVGTVGAAVARGAAALGAMVTIADLDTERAATLAAEIGGDVVPASEVLRLDIDVLAPCAIGGVVDRQVAEQVRAAVVCGAANNILTSPSVEDVFVDREVMFVPDVLSSSGAVILGIGRMVAGLDDCGDLLARVFDTTFEVVGAARDDQRRAGDVAREIAIGRIRDARPDE